ncbi:MAG: rod shape-determining protein MreC [Clostridia bacterium]|nr:rod shape-determining protein MreC [Clostridia bacterium]
MLNFSTDGGKTPHKELVGIVITPFQSAVTWIKNSITNFYDTFGKYEALSNENLELKKQIMQLEDLVNDSYHFQTENEQLKKLVGIKEIHTEFEFVSADVVSQGTDGWASSFSINQGTLSGIKKKNIVITESGLVGYVWDVGLNWASIVTIIDPKVAAGAVITRTGDIAMTESSIELRTKGLCKLSYINTNVSINRGDIVETSGLGGFYPKNLRIGKIESIEVEDHGLSQYAVITPAVDFLNLKKVYVIINFNNEETENEE